MIEPAPKVEPFNWIWRKWLGLARDILRALELKIDSSVYVVDFDVIGDGVTDDTAGFQAAIDSITKGTVVMGEGIFNVSQLTFKTGVSIRGQGPQASIIYGTGSGDTIISSGLLEYTSYKDFSVAHVINSTMYNSYTGSEISNTSGTDITLWDVTNGAQQCLFEHIYLVGKNGVTKYGFVGKARDEVAGISYGFAYNNFNKCKWFGNEHISGSYNTAQIYADMTATSDMSPVTYTDTVSFSGSVISFASNTDLSLIEGGQPINVSGSTSNDGVYIVSSFDDPNDTITVDAVTLVTETSTANVTVHEVKAWESSSNPTKMLDDTPIGLYIKGSNGPASDFRRANINTFTGCHYGNWAIDVLIKEGHGNTFTGCKNESNEDVDDVNDTGGQIASIVVFGDSTATSATNDNAFINWSFEDSPRNQRVWLISGVNNVNNPPAGATFFGGNFFSPSQDISYFKKNVSLSTYMKVQAAGGRQWMISDTRPTDTGVTEQAVVFAGQVPEGRMFFNSTTDMIGGGMIYSGHEFAASENMVSGDGGASAVINASDKAGSITAFADAGGGEVTVTSTQHRLATNYVVVISGTTNYDGTYTITTTERDSFEITATWVSDDATGTWTSENNAEFRVVKTEDGSTYTRLMSLSDKGYYLIPVHMESGLNFNSGVTGGATVLVSGVMTITNNSYIGGADKILYRAGAEQGVGSDAADDLDTITGGEVGDVINIEAQGAHTITVKHGTGNILCNGSADRVINNASSDFISSITLLKKHTGNWTEISYVSV